MTDFNLLERAKQGDPQAIETLMNQSLQDRGMKATVDRQGDLLEVILEAERVPNRQALTAFVQKGIHNLGIASIQSIRVLGQQAGSNYPDWMEELQLGSAVASLNIQPETAPDISKAGLGSSEQAVPLPPLEALPRGAETELSELESHPLDQVNKATQPPPDFLQELLAENATPPTEAVEEPNDESLNDFLSELSEPSETRDFPIEATQDQSIFIDELPSIPTEEEFQDLFAESPQISLDASNLWSDASEIPAGEPDQDLLDFLNQPTDASLNLEEDATLNFPDAMSIDQLPFDSSDEMDTFSGETLEEPSEAFLSDLLNEPADSAPEATDLPAGLPLESHEDSFDSFGSEAPATFTTEFLPEQMPNSTEDLQQALVSEPMEPLPESTISASTESSSEPITSPPLEPAQDPWMEGTEDFITALPEDVDPPPESADYSQDFPDEPATELSAPPWQEEGAGDITGAEAIPAFMTEPPPNSPEQLPEVALYDMPPPPDVIDATLIQSDPGSDPNQPPDFSPIDFIEMTEPPSAASNFGETTDQPSSEYALENFPWFDTAGDVDADVEEIPPDFLQVGYQNEPLFDSDVGTASEPSSSQAPTPAEMPEPTTEESLSASSLEAELAALDLSLPEDFAEDSFTAASADPELNLSEPPANLASDAELADHLSETPEGTTLEPPEDWLTQQSIARQSEDFSAQIEPSPAPSAPSDSATPASLDDQPEVSQDDLEAGLGDFREGFVEPHEFDDSSHDNYPSWQADLQDPLNLDLDADDGTGYVIEDNTPAYTPPLLPQPEETQTASPSEANSSSWIFTIVLLAVSGCVAGLLGFALFWSKVAPPSSPPPATEPPASESPAPAQE